MDTKSLLKQLPKSWDDISLKTFQKIMDLEITNNQDLFDGIQNSISVLSILTNSTVEELEELPMRDLMLLGSGLEFMKVLPKSTDKTSLQLKKIEEITFNDYVFFLNNSENNYIKNLHIYIKTFSKGELTEDEILDLPITDVLNGFFLFRKQLKESLKISIVSTKVDLMKMKVLQRVNPFKRKIRK